MFRHARPRHHRFHGQVRRDRSKELGLRAAGLLVLRYSDEQVEHRAKAVMAEVRGTLTRGERAA